MNLQGANQLNLVITRQDQATITVDNIEVAQFIYLMLNNIKIRDIIDTLTAKTVLILARFTPARKTFLDATRLELRKDLHPELRAFRIGSLDAEHIFETVERHAKG
ncbi:MAG: hypothetical protein M3384_11705 [Acidobacteriota bacterium]|nr:hypothetical protein [Acidobacteriota bacterium]